MAKRKKPRKRIRITLTSHNVNHGLVYQRLHLPFRHLDSDVFDIRCVDITEFRNTDGFYSDLVVMSHPWNAINLHVIERARFHYRIPVISDVDDLINQLPSDHPDYLNFTHNKLTPIIQSSSHMVYSTPYLQAKLCHLNKRSSVIENSIPEAVYKTFKPQHKPHKNCFMFGFTGGQSHRSDQLYTWLDDLRCILREHDDVKFYAHILCPDVLLKEFGSQIIFEPNVCEYLDYPAVSAAYPFDVCLVGLLDHPFNHAKSDLKLLEMSPHEILTLASPRSDFLKHQDKNIMLYADNEDKKFSSWYDQMKWCIEHQDEVKEMSKKARDYVMAERLSTHAAKKWEEVIFQCLDG